MLGYLLLVQYLYKLQADTHTLGVVLPLFTIAATRLR